MLPIVIHHENARALAILSDGRLAVAVRRRVYLYRDGSIIKNYIADEGILALAQSSGGDLVGACHYGKIHVWRDEVLSRTLQNVKGIFFLVILPNNDLVVASQYIIYIWRENKLFKSLRVDSQIGALAILPKGDFVSGHSDGSIHIWKGRFSYSTLYALGSINALVGLANGDLVSGDNREIRTWSDGALIQQIQTKHPITALAELRNNDLISGSKDGCINRWRNGKLIQVLGKGNIVRALKTHDELGLVSLSDEGVICIYPDYKAQRWTPDQKEHDAQPRSFRDNVCAFFSVANRKRYPKCQVTRLPLELQCAVMEWAATP